MDRLDELAIFAAIVQAGGLKAAARRLRRSPPAVTRALADLERRVGLRLVERTTRRVAPTEAGRELADRARRLLDDYEALIGDASSAAARGLLRVTAPVVFGRRHIAPVVASFLDRYPEMQVELILNDRNVDLIADDLHVAVRIGRLADSGLVVRRVGAVRRLTVASPDYLARRGVPTSPADLADHDIVFASGAQILTEWRFGPGDRGPIIHVSPRLIVNDVEAMLTAVRAGRGVARALSYQVADDLASGTLVRLLAEFEPPPLPVQLATPSGRHLAGKTRAFLDHAAQELSRLAVIREGE